MKTTISLTVDTDVVAELQKHDLNVSALVNTYLREHLKLPVISKPRTLVDTESDIIQMEARLTDLRDHKKKLEKSTVVIREI